MVDGNANLLFPFVSRNPALGAAAAAVELVTSEQNRASRNAGEGGYDLKWSPQNWLVFRCEGEPS